MDHKALKILLSVLFMICLFVFLTATGFADQTGPGTDMPPSFLKDGTGDMPKNADSMSVVEMMLKVVISLIIIIVIFMVIIKVLSQKNQKWMTGRTVRTLGGVMLGQNKSLQVVEIGRVIYVIGVGENVQLIDKIDSAEEVAAITDMLSALRHSDKANPYSWLNRWRGRRTGPPEEDISATFSEVFLQKMQNLSNRKKWVEEMLHDDKNENGRMKHE